MFLLGCSSGWFIVLNPEPLQIGFTGRCVAVARRVGGSSVSHEPPTPRRARATPRNAAPHPAAVAGLCRGVSVSSRRVLQAAREGRASRARAAPGAVAGRRASGARAASEHCPRGAQNALRNEYVRAQRMAGPRLQGHYESGATFADSPRSRPSAVCSPPNSTCHTSSPSAPCAQERLGARAALALRPAWREQSARPGRIASPPSHGVGAVVGVGVVVVAPSPSAPSAGRVAGLVFVCATVCPGGLGPVFDARWVPSASGAE